MTISDVMKDLPKNAECLSLSVKYAEEKSD